MVEVSNTPDVASAVLWHNRYIHGPVVVSCIVVNVNDERSNIYNLFNSVLATYNKFRM